MTAPIVRTGAIPRLEPTMSVNELLLKHPSTVKVLNAFGIDACCGGDRSLRDAAREDGADCCALVAALEWDLYEATGK